MLLSRRLLRQPTSVYGINYGYSLGTLATKLFPVSVSEAADFLGSRFDDGCGAATLASIRSAIAFGHRMRNLPDPTLDFCVRTMLIGARRLRPGNDKRLALTVDELHRLCAALRGIRMDPIARAAIHAAFALAFFASHTIRLGGVTVGRTRMVVMVPSSKTSSVPFRIELAARTDLAVCPVGAMREFVAIRGAGSPHSPLFVDGRHCPLSSRFLNRILKMAGPSAGLDPARLSGHCFRIGGASHGAKLGLPDLQIAQAGRWTSITAMRRYVRRPVSLLQSTPSK